MASWYENLQKIQQELARQRKGSGTSSQITRKPPARIKAPTKKQLTAPAVSGILPKPSQSPKSVGRQANDHPNKGNRYRTEAMKVATYDVNGDPTIILVSGLSAEDASIVGRHHNVIGRYLNGNPSMVHDLRSSGNTYVTGGDGTRYRLVGDPYELEDAIHAGYPVTVPDGEDVYGEDES